MIAAFSVCLKDSRLLIDLLKWIEFLGSCKDHVALIVADAATPFEDVLEAQTIADRVFKGCVVVTNDVSTVGWIEGPKSLFLTTAQWAQNNGQPFLLIETDAIPLKAGWLDAIAAEYAACGKPFMGHVYPSGNPSLPPWVMSGIGVYEANTYAKVKDAVQAGGNWDMAMTPVVVPEAHNTKLIHHIWGEMNNPPVFADENIPGTAQFCLKQINPEAVIFHRDKTHSIIRCLKRRDFPAAITTLPITVVFPVAQDIPLALMHARWMRQMGCKHGHRAVISFDGTINVQLLNEFKNLIEPMFASVEMFTYPTPPVRAWPQAPNWAWQHVANHMSHQDRSWLWMEADAVALVPNWLEQLQAEYEKAKHLFMGPKVKGMSHANGCMIYPHDAAIRMPKAMAATTQAWDYICAPDMMHDCHDSSHLSQHIWSIMGEDAIEVGGGQVPVNVTPERAKRWIKPGAVMIHRIKDNSLLTCLMSGSYKP